MIGGNGMDFDYYYLGFLSAGKTVSVKINQQAHVALLDTTNFQRYVNRQRYRHYGGLQSYQKERYRIPYPGEWHVIINIGASSRSIKSEIQIIR